MLRGSLDSGELGDGWGWEEWQNWFPRAAAAKRQNTKYVRTNIAIAILLLWAIESYWEISILNLRRKLLRRFNTNYFLCQDSLYADQWEAGRVRLLLASRVWEVSRGGGLWRHQVTKLPSRRPSGKHFSPYCHEWWLTMLGTKLSR